MAAQRAYRVKVRAQDLAGQPLTLTLTDWRARIFQHEFDHLQVHPLLAMRTVTSCTFLPRSSPGKKLHLICNLHSEHMQSGQNMHIAVSLVYSRVMVKPHVIWVEKVNAVCVGQGVLFHDRMAPNVLASVRDKLVMLEEEYLREHPGTPVQRVLQPQPS